MKGCTFGTENCRGFAIFVLSGFRHVLPVAAAGFARPSVLLLEGSCGPAIRTIKSGCSRFCQQRAILAQGGGHLERLFSGEQELRRATLSREYLSLHFAQFVLSRE
eukprot:2815726-Amphidinium_carterae.1